MYVSGIIGAVPRMGKTFLLRLLLLIACMDLRAEIHAYDLKGTGDLSTVGRVAHRYRAGDEEEDIAYALADLRELRAELRRRAKVLRELPKDLCPESKVTSALADRKNLRPAPDRHRRGRVPDVVRTPEVRGRVRRALHGPGQARTRRSASRFCWPRSARTPSPCRPGSPRTPRFGWCLKVMGQIENDMVLGTGSYKRGIRANTLAWADKGICWFVGEGADARIVRCGVRRRPEPPTPWPCASTACASTRACSTGHALGEAPDATPPRVRPPHRPRRRAPRGKAKTWSEDIVARLSELRPDVYGQWTPEQLAAAVKPYGIRTVQVWGTTEDGKGVNRRGLRRSDVLDAITHRDEHSDDA